jgi:hypothetical protein
MSIKSSFDTKIFKKGFLLPDVMFAVFVTISTLVVIMAAMLPLLKSEFYKRDEIIATGLAQEGIEIIRNVRDNNWKTCTDGSPTPCVDPIVTRTAFANPSFPSDGTICVDYNTFSSGASTTCSAGGALYNNAGAYTHSVSGVSKFKRTITISPSGSDRTVVSRVTWGVVPAMHTVTLTDTLTAWGDK